MSEAQKATERRERKRGERAARWEGREEAQKLGIWEQRPSHVRMSDQ